MSHQQEIIEPNRDVPGYSGSNTWIDRFERKTYNANVKYKKVNKENLRIKDKATRFFIDNEYIEKGYMATLPFVTTAVYMTILKYSNTKTQAAFPGITTICRLSGIKNRNYVIASINILTDLNIIQTIRSKGGVNNSNLYAFVNSDFWNGIDSYYKGKRLKIKQYQTTKKAVSNNDNNEYQ